MNKKTKYNLLNGSEIVNLAKKTIVNLKFNFRTIVFFEICYRILVAFLFVPINHFIVKKFMNAEDIFALTNKEFLKFAVTPLGVASSIVLMIICFLIVFIEISVLTYILYNSHKKEKVTIIEGLFNSFKIIPKVLRRTMIRLFLITSIIGPLIGIGFYSSLIRKLSVPPFITLELFKTMMGRSIFIALTLVMIIILIRWILAIPEIIIEDRPGKKCIKNSVALYKKNKITLITYTVLWTIINSSILTMIVKAFRFSQIFLANILGNNSRIFLIVGGITLGIFYILYTITSMIMMPLFISSLVELFYKIRGGKIKERDFSTVDDYKKNVFYLFLRKFSPLYLKISVIIFVMFISVRGYDVIFNKTIPKNAEITAHRGSTINAPENSLLSINEAIEKNADYAEIDVQTTKDNVVVLFHDLNLKRINGDNREIKDLTYEEVSKIDNGSYFRKEFNYVRIPMLEEVLKEAKGKIKLNIELKPMKEDDYILPMEVVKLVKKYDMEDEVVITCVNYHILQIAKNIDPMIKYGYILVMSMGDLNRLDVDFVSVESSIVKPSFVSKMHNRGKEVHVWTINNRNEAKQMLSIGVDNIITDDVNMINDVKKSIDFDSLDYLQFYLEAITNIWKYAKI